MDTFHDCAPKSKDVWYEIGSKILVYFIERRSEEVKFTIVIKTYKLHWVWKVCQNDAIRELSVSQQKLVRQVVRSVSV